MNNNNNGSGSPFVNKLTALYLDKIAPEQRLDVIETFVDTAADSSISNKAKNRIAIALDFYAAKNDLSDEDYDEIDAFYDNTVDKDIVQQNMIPMPNSEKEALDIFAATAKGQKFLYLEKYFTHLASDIFIQMLPYYIGETLILYEEKTISKAQYHRLWNIFNGHADKEDIQDYFSETHDFFIENFGSAEFHQELQTNIALRDNIATDWLIFMQEHSDINGDELMDRTFYLMSSEE